MWKTENEEISQLYNFKKKKLVNYHRFGKILKKEYCIFEKLRT